VIVAAGLTPALQHLIVFESLDVGEVNRAREVHWFSSGKVINAGIALHRLGRPCMTVSLRGGASGESLERELGDLGIPCRWVPVSRPTRVCTTLLDLSTGAVTELVENAAAVSAAEVAAFLDAFEEAARGATTVVLIGSLPEGAPSSFYAALMARSRSRVVLDARGKELLEALPLRPFLVKPNREELGRTFGRRLDTDDDLRHAMLETRRLGAEWVVVSQGRAALWALGPTGLHVFHPPQVGAVNPIGCGDCMAAGIAWAIDAGKDVLEAIRLGMGAAAQNATMLLTSRLDPETVRRFAAQVVMDPPLISRESGGSDTEAAG
jgi:1-phosphofructokinase family hexose kinase